MKPARHFLLICTFVLASLTFPASAHDPSLHGFNLTTFDPPFPAPAFDLETLNGSPTKLSDYKGQYVLLNFWATWCPPCLEEMPSMEGAFQRYKDKGFTVLAISSDEEGKTAVEPFVEKLGVTFPIMFDPDKAVSSIYGCSVTHAQDDDPVVAIVNDYPIKWSDIDFLVSQLPLGEQVTEIKTLAVNALIEKHVTSKLIVSEDDIQEFYDGNTSAIRGETIQVSHILTETRTECEGLMVQIESGVAFADLAIEHSIHEASAVNGGQLGSLMNHDGPLGFEQQLFEIPQDQPTLYESEDGCHIVMVTGRETPPLPPLENVSAAIENLLRRELEIEVLQAFMAQAHENVNVVRPE